MEKNIRVLVVDDSIDATDLIIRQLTKEGYAPSFVRVDIASHFVEQLQKKDPWNVIILDHVLPRFSSREAIELVKQEKLDIPIIIVSEIIGEEEVVKAMQLGAHDIVLKNNLSRLAPVIEREMREKEVRDKKRAAEERVTILSQAVEQSRNMVFISDESGVITYVNSSFRELTGYSDEEVYMQTATLLNASDDRVRTWGNDKICCSWHEQQLNVVFSGKNWRGEVLVKPKNREEFWTLVSISPIKNSEGKVVNLVNVGEDLSELKEKENELARLAFYDSVTGLANRRLLDDRLEQLIKSTKRYGNSAALLCLDLDKFKKVNDTLGHGAGDSLLKWVADNLLSCIRDSDTAARTGGDEFHILITNLESEDLVRSVADKILKRLNEPFTSGSKSITVTTSIGIVLIPRDGDNIKELKMKGDIALYYAKDKGRNNYQHYVDGMKLEKIEQEKSKAS